MVWDANGDVGGFNGGPATFITPSVQPQAQGLRRKKRRFDTVPGQPPAPMGQPPVGQPPINIAPPVPQAPTGDVGGALGDFGPGNDLRFQQINPEASDRLKGIRGGVDTARQRFQGYQPGAFQGIDAGNASDFGDVGAGGFDPNADTTRARQLTSQGLESLNSGPDRQKLAEDSYASLAKLDAANEGKDIQGVGRRAAATGRLGSGMVDSELGDVFGQHDATLANIKSQLAATTAGQSQADKLARLNAFSSTGGQFQGEDLATAGFRQGLRGEQRGERGQKLDFQTGLRNEARTERGARRTADTGNFDITARQFGGLQDAESGQNADELSRRNELRGERGYQGDVANQASEQAIRQRQLQEDLLNSKFNRARIRSGVQAGQADQSGEQAGGAEDDIGQLLALLAKRKAGG